MSADKDKSERFICFSLNKEEYAIPLLSVKEVIAVSEITPVPQTPPHFLGITNLRGQVISVIDLKAKLGMKPSTAAEPAIIICDIGDTGVGVVVDSINNVINPSAEQIAAKPEIDSKVKTDYIIGVYRENERFVILLDIARALNIEGSKLGKGHA